MCQRWVQLGNFEVHFLSGQECSDRCVLQSGVFIEKPSEQRVATGTLPSLFVSSVGCGHRAGTWAAV